MDSLYPDFDDEDADDVGDISEERSSTFLPVFVFLMVVGTAETRLRAAAAARRRGCLALSFASASGDMPEPTGD